jgi:cathepsin C
MRALVVAVALFASVALVGVTQVRADLPIHCLNSQVAGSWVFEMSADTYDKSESCGYHAPDVNALHFTKKAMKFAVAKKLAFTLVQPNQVHDAAGKIIGHWTMIYDEGFEVVVNGQVFFAFNKYHPKKHTSLNSEEVGDYVSICDKTMIGWFHNKEKTRYGCYRGYQTAKLRFREANANADEADAESESESEDETEESAPEQRHAPSPSAKPFNPNHVVSPFAFEAEAKHAHPIGTSGDLDVEPTAFYELETVTRENRKSSRNTVRRVAHHSSDEMFVPSAAFVETHNSNARSTWKAGIHEQFLGKRMAEMDRILGRKRYTAHNVGSGDVGPNIPRGPLNKKSRKYLSELSKMPREYSWIKYDTPVRNQGECGACYSMAATDVANIRLRIATQMKDKTILSPQDVLSCSRTNQGCEGGYPFLVGKHAAEYGLVPEACVPYKASDIDCDSVRFTSSSCASKRYFAKNYRYVGGYYGSCNELLMMKEVMRNGPVIVAFQAPSSLFYYTGGIFTGPPPKHEGATEHGVRYWEQTNHAVVAMGWGEENGHKYWIIKNTWGPKWGENGYFRIQRGTDECGVESMATTFDMVI